MARLVITFDLPAGVIPDVQYLEDAQPAPQYAPVGQAQTTQQAPQAPVAQAVYQQAAEVFGTDVVVPQCPQHGAMAYYPAGHRKSDGKSFNASYRCPAGRDCPTPAVWQKGPA